MANHSESLEHWIRTAFVEMNTELENLYFAREDRSDVEGVGDAIKLNLRDEGRALIKALLDEGNTDEGFEAAFGLLGNIGFYLGALRRHELTNPDIDERATVAEASALALHVGAATGMAPRFATAHLATHNRARSGVRKSFTSLADEFLFIDENTRAILSFQRAADALLRILPLGVSSPVTDVLYADAAQALVQVAAINARLFSTLGVDRFFFSVRPYYKPYRVGRTVYRGANAGDFAGINEIDLLLGVCQASDTFYSQMLHDKLPYMLPADQLRLRDCMRHRSLLDELLELADDHEAQPWFLASAGAFLQLCDLYAETARQHHDQLVRRFIELPAGHLEAGRLNAITASGPPLEILLRSLERLRDLRCAAPRADIPSRHDDLRRLRDLVTAGRDPLPQPTEAAI